MFVSECINLLVAGELKPLAVSNIGGEVRNQEQEDNLRILVSFIDMANKALHEKFALIQRELVFEEVYHNQPITLPRDFIYPINAALRDGTQVPINNEMKLLGNGTDSLLSLLFPEPYMCLVKGEDPAGQTDVSLVYVGEPEAITKVTHEIMLTNVFTQAILDYVAYRAYIGQDGHVDQTNNTYYMRYIADCKMIREAGLTAIDNLNSNAKLYMRGFV